MNVATPNDSTSVENKDITILCSTDPVEDDIVTVEGDNTIVHIRWEALTLVTLTHEDGKPVLDITNGVTKKTYRMNDTACLNMVRQHLQ